MSTNQQIIMDPLLVLDADDGGGLFPEFLTLWGDQSSVDEGGGMEVLALPDDFQIMDDEGGTTDHQLIMDFGEVGVGDRMGFLAVPDDRQIVDCGEGMEFLAHQMCFLAVPDAQEIMDGGEGRVSDHEIVDHGEDAEGHQKILGTKIQGKKILLQHPNDLHFLCGCANFDPCSHNEIFRDEARKYFRDKVVGDADQCKISLRPEVPFVLEKAHLKAQEVTGFQDSKFRIWKPNLAPRTRLSEANWEDLLFQDITDNLGLLKTSLEPPLRKARDDALNDVRIRISISTPLGLNPSSLSLPAPIPESVQSFKRAKSESESIVQGFVDRYDEQSYLDALERLHKDRGSQNMEEWAKKLYTTFRKYPDDERAKRLNKDRKECLKLLYDLVTEWKIYGFSQEFEQAIDSVFKKRRLERILSICLPMDRAQALYKMVNGTSTRCGMHWYSKCHLQTDNSYARDHRDEQRKWIGCMNFFSDPPTMNWKLFRLLFSDRFGLRSNEDFRKWSRPAKVPQQAQDSTASGP